MAPSQPSSCARFRGLATVLSGFISAPSHLTHHQITHQKQCHNNIHGAISDYRQMTLKIPPPYTAGIIANNGIHDTKMPTPITSLKMSPRDDSSIIDFLDEEIVGQEVLDEVIENEGGTIVESPVMFASEDETENFDFIRWERHRSPVRYTRLLIGTFFGVTTRRIFPIVMLLAGFSAAVDVYTAYGQEYGLPDVALPLVPFELTAPVLGLLLVFRSNTAYERFNTGSDESWEITGRFRSVIRQLTSWTANKERFSNEERLAAYDLVDACVLMHWIIMHDYLRPGHVESPQERAKLFRKALALGNPTDDKTQTARIQQMILGSDETSRLTPSGGVTAISLGITTRLPSLDTQETTQIDEQFCEIMSSLGTCEKLLRTPIPLGYTRYSVRFLWVWLTLLPLALVNKFAEFGERPVLVLAMVITSFSFLSIEEISVQIEEPFCILPLELHHKWLVRDVKQVKRMSRVVDRIYLEREMMASKKEMTNGDYENQQAINGDSDGDDSSDDLKDDSNKLQQEQEKEQYDESSELPPTEQQRAITGSSSRKFSSIRKIGRKVKSRLKQKQQSRNSVTTDMAESGSGKETILNGE